MMKLSLGEMTALKNLALKSTGVAVDWISIADARALTEKGLAQRNREGWVITAAGTGLLATYDGPQEMP